MNKTICAIALASVFLSAGAIASPGNPGDCYAYQDGYGYHDGYHRGPHGGMMFGRGGPFRDGPRGFGNSKTNSAAGKSVSFWNGVKSEFSKIIWPTKEKLTRQSVAVVVITVITAALIAVLDRGLQYGINFVIK